MGSQKVRTIISENNKYYVPKNRMYELKYHCLQYNEWKKKCNELKQANFPGGIMSIEDRMNPSGRSSKVEDMAIKLAVYQAKMRQIETVCEYTDPDIGNYIFLAVTNDLSYVNLKMMYNIPCGKDMYYDRYRKFFWLLDMAM